MKNATEDKSVTTVAVAGMTPNVNPKAVIRELGIDAALAEEFKGLVGDEATMAAAHIKQSLKNGQTPIAPSNWIYCPDPDCSYRTPNSLISHIQSKHGGVNVLSERLGILPQQIVLTSPLLNERFRSAGAKGQAGKVAKAAAAAQTAEDAVVDQLDEAVGL